MIDIIIPAYNAHGTIKQTLLSIGLQTIKNKVNVYIIDDFSDIGYDEEINLFKSKFNITGLRLNKNSGPGVARQYGIDNSSGKYILFLDSDDILVDCFSLEKIYKKILVTKADMCVGVMIDETEDGLFEYNNHQGCLHGKLYKRSFLEKNNIKFNDTRNHEDNSFNNLVILHEPKIVYVNYYIYLYHNNIESITQVDKKDYNFNSLKWYIYNMVWAVKVAQKHNCRKKLISIFIYKSYLYVYYSYLIERNRYDSNLILSGAKEMEQLVSKYENILSDNQKFQLYNEYTCNKIPHISFDEFRKLVRLS